MTLERELNEKIARWLWKGDTFYYSQNCLCHSPHDSKSGITLDVLLPICDYTQSLDACFTEIAPKLAEQGLVITVGSFEHRGYYALVYHFDEPEPEQIRDDKSPALALCRAIERLIDKDKP